MVSAVVTLRSAIKAKKPLTLLPEGSDISGAQQLVIGDQAISLDEETGFTNEEDKVNETLRAIYQSWLHRDSNTTDYFADCEAKKIPVISFMERTELISYLSGASEKCEHLKGEEEKEDNEEQKKRGAKSDKTAGGKRQKIIDSDPFLKLVLSNEREVVDHNKALRGSKLVDFSNVAKECEYKIIRPLKKSSSKSGRYHRHGADGVSGAAGVAGAVGAVGAGSQSLSAILKHKDPIIILSPSASALINMGNVKSFLEEGKFIDPSSENNSVSMQKIVRNSKLFNKKIKFVVVNDVDKFFTKPEHWDRVVAVFTTGQQWQFKNYRDSKPNALFQKVKGFYVHYNGDPIPESIETWNLEVISIERSRRFKDRQTSEYLWEMVEKFMASRGYK
ncbi:hypothetical protein FOA43_002044 [Brettanomyces nanus]|uniref:Cell division control protein 73 C-terminal domain-containing protein n=1 Tax=Eeniella nana TaxID=13502 RepID=A0A875RYU9_EENNA|nr:uncharacterized protein FOA43_002044 [Brettanomyces nanus]QPG74711.1 hypothetical protein FOA43_002044 [Brettanomyces nanus]